MPPQLEAKKKHYGFYLVTPHSLDTNISYLCNGRSRICLL
ncbi:DNA-(Apurinic or apyrimidinic site) lyase (fragment) [Brochothrix thermosphacta]